MGCDNFSHDYALPSGWVKHDLIVGGGWGQAQGGEMLPTLAVGCDELQRWVTRKQGASVK